MIPGKFYGQYEPEVDRLLFNYFFPLESQRGKSFVAIECGAADGLYLSSCKFFEENRGWTCINLEPDPILFRKLVRNRPDSINLNVGLSDSSGEKSFSRHVEPTGEIGLCGSISHCPEQIKELEGYYHSHLQKIDIETVTYQQLIANLKLNHVDLMVLDVEGYELTILKTLARDMILPTVLCVETDWIPPEDVNRVLIPLDYKPAFSFKSNSYYIR